MSMAMAEAQNYNPRLLSLWQNVASVTCNNYCPDYYTPSCKGPYKWSDHG